MGVATRGEGSRSWFGRFWRGESFYPLFILLLVSLVFIIGGSDHRWAAIVGHILASTSLLLTVRACHASRIWQSFGWITLVIGIAGALLQSLLDVRILRGLIALVFTVLLFASVPLILRRLIAQRLVTAETIVGALSAYILIGMDFAVLHVLLSAVEGHATIMSMASPDAGITRGDFYYHSFVTMTTVGFGDFAPVNGVGKTLAVLEGVLGQLFLVTIVARVVSVAVIRQGKSFSDQDESGPEHE
jgi:uncharacterized membrane protein